MVTAKERSSIRDFARENEIPVEWIDERGRRCYWRRRDGTLTPTTMPFDPHHIPLYQRKGWTPVFDLTEADMGPVPQPPEPAAPVPQHRHVYNKRGTQCKYPGCSQPRQIAYQPRK